MTVVNVALPTIRADLGFALPDLQWLINAYTICFGGFFLLAGRAGDMFGRRRVFLAGVAAFTLASLASGMAPGPGLLIGARAVQGLAAAFVVPLTLAMIAVQFPGRKAPQHRADRVGNHHRDQCIAGPGGRGAAGNRTGLA